MLLLGLHQKTICVARCSRSVFKNKSGKYKSFRSYSSNINKNSRSNVRKPEWIPYSHENIGLFFQEKPKLCHPFISDSFLQRYLGCTVPKEVFNEISKDLTCFGERIVKEIDDLGRQCELNLPALKCQDAWGIGKVTALRLAERNARVLMACRNLAKAEEVKSEIISATGNDNIEVKYLELESFSSVRKCAEEVIKTEKRLDVLINNAGVAHYDGTVKTEDGWEANMQVNHLGHFLLTLLLLDLLKRSKRSRIINVSSIMYLIAVLDLKDMDGSKHPLFLTHLGNLYYRTKLANVLFTTELARRLEGTGVTVNALHPGLINTQIFYRENHPVLSMYRLLLYFFGKSPEEGAQTTLYLAVNPDLENVTGKFFLDCQEFRLMGKAKDKAMARKLFKISEEVVGEKFKD